MPCDFVLRYKNAAATTVSPGNPLKYDCQHEDGDERGDDVMFLVTSPWQRIRLPHDAGQLAHHCGRYHGQVDLDDDRHLAYKSNIANTGLHRRRNWGGGGARGPGPPDFFV